ncbi:hypothetical protein PM032_14335 [Halorubrum ezzemoulense]|uniref:hypothetical protein n=1 Tax=Halorubrum ezzemoulense TaxID=337243 RepID=UPI00232D5159|nr:hypothetical protein [Halorubrum ezzemoulense]MDB2272187.1 hypothetical protein [Halorubrum ezzemoulense]
MARSSQSRSGRKGDDADVSYNVNLPFENRDATIYLFAQEGETVEVLIGHIPEPVRFHDNYNATERDVLDQHAVARWILDEAGQELDEWDYNKSSYKTNNPNYHLRDVYFECGMNEVNDAVLAAKRFLNILEEKVIRQRELDNKNHRTSPQQTLQSEISN